TSYPGLANPVVINASLLADPFAGHVFAPGEEFTIKGTGGIDSIWRIGGITVEEVLPQMKALVDSTTGEVRLSNSGTIPLSFDAYQILSSDGALKTGNSDWLSLSDSNVDSMGPGVGQSWDEGTLSNASAVSERFLHGQTALAPGASI